MDDLVRWLGEQLDEDEADAKAVLWDGSGNKLAWELAASATIDVGEDEFYAGDRTIANHIVRHDPARVLREIDAKREIVRQADLYLCDAGPGCGYRTKHGHNVLRLLALPYADRPGYLEKWRP